MKLVSAHPVSKQGNEGTLREWKTLFIRNRGSSGLVHLTELLRDF